MDRSLSIEFSRVTEIGALAAYSWLGRGDKNAADLAAVEAMRIMLNKIDMQATIVIGEGEIDEAPMLYIGEQVGTGLGEEISIAVDPIDGTRMTAMGQSNAISVIAAGDADSFLQAPDMYMEKMVVGNDAKGMIDLNFSLEENLRRVASKKGKSLSALTVAVLDKPRHKTIIAEMQKLGVRVFAIPDGDVEGAILCCLPETYIDMLYGIGGSPEGVIAATAIRALDGDMQARLLPRTAVKGDTDENRAIEKEELARCEQMGVKVNEILTLDKLVKNDNIIFAATGITNGNLVKGVHRTGNIAHTETLMIRGKSRTIRRIQSLHYLDRKSDAIYKLIKN